MLSGFTVKGFKSLLETDVELGPINVFIGANGSGKSNLLEAIGVMGAAAFGSVEPETLRYRGVRPGLPSLYKTSFKHAVIRRIITLEARAEGAVYRLGLDNPISKPTSRWRISTEFLGNNGNPVFSRGPRASSLYREDGSKERVLVRTDQTAAKLALGIRKDDSPASTLVADLEHFAIYAPTTPVLRGIAHEDVIRDPLGLTGGGLPEVVKALVNNSDETFGDFDLDDVFELIDWANALAAVTAPLAQVSPAVRTTPLVLRFADRFMRKGRNVLSAYDASEGALYVLFFLALVSHERAPRVLAIDNFDQTLHPRLATALTQLVTRQVLKDGTRQLLMTTHNPLVLDGLDLADDRVRLFAVDRDTNGVTGVQRIIVTPKLLKEAKKGLSLSRLWVMGRFGGVPRNL